MQDTAKACLSERVKLQRSCSFTVDPADSQEMGNPNKGLATMKTSADLGRRGTNLCFRRASIFASSLIVAVCALASWTSTTREEI